MRSRGLREIKYQDEEEDGLRGGEREADEPAGRKKAPLILRLIAWAAVIVIFFGCGYGATSLLFSWMDGRLGSGGERSPGNLTATPAETEAAIARARSADTARDLSIATYTLHIPNGKDFDRRDFKCQASIKDDAIRQTVSAYLDAVKELSMLDPQTAALTLFQSGDTLYLNMNSVFMSSLVSMGAERTRFMITGLIRTMSDNFKPLSKVKFYIDGKEPKDKKPVDLTQPWGIS